MLQVGKKLEKMSMRQLEDWKEQSEELEAETALRQTVTDGYLFQILNCHLIIVCDDFTQTRSQGSSRTKKTVKKADIVCFGRPPPLNR